MEIHNYFTLFSNCIPVVGAKEACIYDMQYGAMYKVPKQLLPILKEIRDIPLGGLAKNFDNETYTVLLRYIDFFIEHDLGHWTSHPEWFPPISNEWDFPAVITNAIIEMTHDLSMLDNVIKQLNDLNCKALEIRVYRSIRDEELQFIVDSTNSTGMQSVHLYLSEFHDCNIEFWTNIMQSNPRLYFVAIFGKKEDKRFDIENNYYVCHRIGMLHKNRCGGVGQMMFSINIPTYTESLHHNSCLNRKISIDIEGNIKNCPSMIESFGNIRDTTLAEAIEKPSFKKYWDITKDKIYVCKDCEFRYICTDCRAYVEDPKDIYSKPLKCGYNPYTGEWSEWSQNPLKQKAIEYYELKDVINNGDTNT